MRKPIRRLLTIFAAAAVALPAALAAPASAAPAVTVVSEKRVDARILDLTVNSQAIGQQANVRLLLPDGWDGRQPGKTWPVLLLLGGCCWSDGDGHESWVQKTDVETYPELRKVIVVQPIGGKAGYFSNWKQAGGPRWEDFHLDEVLPLVEKNYGGGRKRAIAGLSMGGFGALSYAGRRPGMFAAAASYSGTVHTQLFMLGPSSVQAVLIGQGLDPNGLWGDPVKDEKTWAEHNPAELTDNLKKIPVYLSSGNGEPGPLDAPGAGFDVKEKTIEGMSQLVATKLLLSGGKVQTSFYGKGTHAWPYYGRELKNSLPMLMGALGV
ncbi:alpha/beta hydrolase [Allokutzneria albata]|uniref:S-formylglutathione hydrolase FrmB n=1 Tax=Allokutzneria albata TaxID=211114 RepID=A0A1G9ZND5_ALLAB|nr:alpha/beta hydrolase family protein [Allokutzneria albata]SDN22879.1 S-formylglutathione hydrolase FrmB [Allokutzneria albata]